MTETLDKPVEEAAPLPEYNARRIGFAAGVVAAVVMLVTIVVLRVLSEVESLPEVVAEGVLVNLPGALFSAVLDSLQHAAKPLFYLGIGIAMLVVGGFIGRWYATRPTWQRAVQTVLGVWLVFGVVVYTLLGAGIFGQYLRAGPAWHGASLLVVFGVFGLALWQAFKTLAHRAQPALPDTSRRLLLRNAGVGLAPTVGAGRVRRLMSSGPGGTTAPVLVGVSPAPSDTPVLNAPPLDLAGTSPEVTGVPARY